MPGPSYQSLNAVQPVHSASATTITPTKPTIANNGAMLLVVLATKNNATHATATAGWTRQGPQVNSGAGYTASIWTARATAAAPVFTWTGAAAASVWMWYYDDPANPPDITLGSLTSNTGSGATHSSSAISSTMTDSLFVAIDVTSTNANIPATPSGWTRNNFNTGGAGGTAIALYSKAAGASGSSSGAISVTGQAFPWVQWQLEIKTSVSPGGLQASKMEVDVWYEPASGLAASKVEVDVWYQPPAGFAASKVEVDAWLEPEPGVAASKIERGGWVEPPDGTSAAKMERGAWLVPTPDQLAVSKVERGLWLDIIPIVTSSWKRAAQIIG